MHIVGSKSYINNSVLNLWLTAKQKSCQLCVYALPNHRNLTPPPRCQMEQNFRFFRDFDQNGAKQGSEGGGGPRDSCDKSRHDITAKRACSFVSADSCAEGREKNWRVKILRRAKPKKKLELTYWCCIVMVWRKFETRCARALKVWRNPGFAARGYGNTKINCGRP